MLVALEELNLPHPLSYCVWVQWRPEEAFGFPGSVTGHLSHLPNTGPLEEQQVLIAAEPSFHSGVGTLILGGIKIDRERIDKNQHRSEGREQESRW